jgi:ABC-type branched-subunit amino acid transport system substrate-binding protein
MRSTHFICALIFLASAGFKAHAQILIGQTLGVTGAVAATVKESTFGASLYIDAVNAKGGIRGEKIEIITLDDKFDPKLTVENTKTLIERNRVVAMFMTRGTPHTESILPLLDQYAIPLIGPSTGAKAVHTPVLRHVFNVRATYQREAERAIIHNASIGTTRIAVVHVDDSFGKDGLEGALKGFAAANLKPVLIAKFDRSKPDFSAITPQLLSTEAQTVIFIGSGTAVVDGILAANVAKVRAQYITLSNNASQGFIKQLGKNARGVIVTQVFPRTFAYSFVKEAYELAKARKVDSVSPAMLEGFSAAKVLVEALRRCNGMPTRERIQAALEGMQKFDLGGLEISYSPSDHSGLDFSDLSIINANGKFMR